MKKFFNLYYNPVFLELVPPDQHSNSIQSGVFALYLPFSLFAAISIINTSYVIWNKLRLQGGYVSITLGAGFSTRRTSIGNAEGD